MPKCTACGVLMGNGFICKHPKIDGKFVCFNCCSGVRKGKKCGNFDKEKKICRLWRVESENHSK